MNPHEAIESLECSILVPEAASEEMRTTSRVIDLDKDKRRFRRFTCNIEAAMQYKSGLHAKRRSNGWVRVLVRNVSRCSVGFWHGESMYPLEQALIVLPNGIQRLLEVKTCRRVGPNCFAIGGEFAVPLDNPGQSLHS